MQRQNVLKVGHRSSCRSGRTYVVESPEQTRADLAVEHNIHWCLAGDFAASRCVTQDLRCGFVRPTGGCLQSAAFEREAKSGLCTVCSNARTWRSLSGASDPYELAMEQVTEWVWPTESRSSTLSGLHPTIALTFCKALRSQGNFEGTWTGDASHCVLRTRTSHMIQAYTRLLDITTPYLNKMCFFGQRFRRLPDVTSRCRRDWSVVRTLAGGTVLGGRPVGCGRQSRVACSHTNSHTQSLLTLGLHVAVAMALDALLRSALSLVWPALNRSRHARSGPLSG